MSSSPRATTERSLETSRRPSRQVMELKLAPQSMKTTFPASMSCDDSPDSEAGANRARSATPRFAASDFGTKQGSVGMMRIQLSLMRVRTFAHLGDDPSCSRGHERRSVPLCVTPQVFALRSSSARNRRPMASRSRSCSTARGELSRSRPSCRMTRTGIVSCPTGSSANVCCRRALVANPSQVVRADPGLNRPMVDRTVTS